MVEVFRTNVQEQPEAEKLAALLQKLLPGSRVSFDLDDCDKILRIEGESFLAEIVAEALQKKGYVCVVLE